MCVCVLFIGVDAKENKDCATQRYVFLDQGRWKRREGGREGKIQTGFLFVCKYVVCETPQHNYKRYGVF